MSIDRAETLKKEWTDQFVKVQSGVPELRRFEGLVGRVRTVNMNCRVLVEFDTPADISWYDIDPRFLLITTAPKSDATETETPETTGSSAAAIKPPAAAAEPSAKSATAKAVSPLDLIRQQAKTPAGDDSQNEPSTAAEQTSTSAAAPTNPLDLIRQQGAAKQAESAATSPEPAAAPATSGSPLDLIRQQNAAGKQADAKATGTAPPPTKTAASAKQPEPAQSPPAAEAKSPNVPAAVAAEPTAPTEGRVGGRESFSADTIPHFSAGLTEKDSRPLSFAPSEQESVLDQIRNQAGEPPSATPDIFQQVRNQAAADDAVEATAR